MSGATLIVGIGSPHGDDQIGWRIAEALMAEHRVGWIIRTARSPTDLLAWLDDKVERLVICDACDGFESSRRTNGAANSHGLEAHATWHGLPARAEQTALCSAGPLRAVGELHVWKWPAPEIQYSRASGSHDLGLPSALELAHKLGRLPACVVVCAVNAKQYAHNAGLSRELAAVLPGVVSQIRDICDLAAGDCRDTTPRTIPQPNVG
jgi:hydrogenase maturation protease